MNHVVKQKGFTLIELMLAMTFIAMLLLAIALTIIQIGNIYNRGMTLKEINQAARNVGDEMTRAMSSTESFSLTNKYVVIPDVGGRLCLGQNSYIWNLGKALDKSPTPSGLVTYPVGSPKVGTKIRFIKVPDPSGLYCLKNSSGNPLYPQIRLADANLTIDMVKEGDRTLTLHQFALTQGTNASDPVTGQQLYSFDFSIGTAKSSALTSDQSACLPPSDPNSDFAYCSVQKFSLVVRAGDKVN